VHPYTYRNEDKFLHWNFNEDPYMEFDYWINQIQVDGLFTDFTGSLNKFLEWTHPSHQGGIDDDNADADSILHKIAAMLAKYNRKK